jgi:hypothetical protein
LPPYAADADALAEYEWLQRTPLLPVQDAAACAAPGRAAAIAVVATKPPPNVPDPEPDAFALARAPLDAAAAELLAL